MKAPRRLLCRLVVSTTRRFDEERLREELEAHLEMQTAVPDESVYTVYVSQKNADTSTILTIRVTPDLDRRLAREARRRRSTRSATARELLKAALTGTADVDPAREARRQSLRVRDSESEQEALDFIAAAADLRGWR